MQQMPSVLTKNIPGKQFKYQNVNIKIVWTSVVNKCCYFQWKINISNAAKLGTLVKVTKTSVIGAGAQIVTAAV